MIRLVCTIFFCSFPVWLLAQQPIDEYVRQHASPVRNINPDSTAFDDLEALGRAIGNKRIVLLGEQDHGDAASFLAKTRIVRYLHEKKGFHVLAFESDFFSLTNGLDAQQKTTDNLSTFLRKHIASVWSACDACQFLLRRYIPESYQTTIPLHVTGVDNQLLMWHSNKQLTRTLDSALRALQLPGTRQSDYTQQTLPLIDTLTKFINARKSPGFYNNAIEQLTALQQEVKQAEPEGYWQILIENLIQMAYEFKYLPEDADKGRNYRDQQMAANLKWLASKRYKDEKIIVWAQNFHVSKHNGHYQKTFNDLVSMGAAFTKDSAWDAQTYVVGFTSFAGETGWAGSKPHAIDAPEKKSLENWIPADYNYAFVDFMPYNQEHLLETTRFYMNGSVVDKLHHPYKAEWTRIFDAVFFIRNMTACKLSR
jgi:erythromycin esterase-like protein